MNDKVEIEYEHLPNGYWRASFILSSKSIDKQIMDCCSSFHTLEEARYWAESEIKFVNVIGV